MPAQDQLFLRPSKPTGYNQPNMMDAGPEFIMGQIAALPTRGELIRFGVLVALGLCVLCMTMSKDRVG